MAASFYAQGIVHIEAVAQRGMGNPVVMTVTDHEGGQVMVYLFLDTPERASAIEAMFTAIYEDVQNPADIIDD